MEARRVELGSGWRQSLTGNVCCSEGFQKTCKVSGRTGAASCIMVNMSRMLVQWWLRRIDVREEEVEWNDEMRMDGNSGDSEVTVTVLFLDYITQSGLAL